ncbi:hypothetical protein [Richelia intracellularis]|uniref:hypothetical protein n=1 Tax=Richelia intracellularis TaxID=1164990 RepID=UPI0018C8CE70|nr:hypothetical protein [Richelia intracellularis]
MPMIPLIRLKKIIQLMLRYLWCLGNRWYIDHVGRQAERARRNREADVLELDPPAKTQGLDLCRICVVLILALQGVEQAGML